MKYFTLLFFCQISFAQSIKGIVTENNNPLPFVNIIEIGSNLGTQTNEKGFFELNLKEGNNSLAFSCLGYITKKVDILVQNNKTNTLNIELEPDTKMLAG